MLREYNTLHAIQAGDSLKTKSGITISILEVVLETDENKNYVPEISFNVPDLVKCYFVDMYLDSFIEFVSKDITPNEFILYAKECCST